jgi:hypothetical protein
VNDAKNIYHFLTGEHSFEFIVVCQMLMISLCLADRLGFRARDIIRLTDEARDPRNMPTRANILGAMRWLVRGARKHDSLFFHCAFLFAVLIGFTNTHHQTQDMVPKSEIEMETK